MAEFFNMGGHAVFVWSSYAITFVVILGIFLWPIFARKHIVKTLIKNQKRQQQLAKRKSLTDDS